MGFVDAIKRWKLAQKGMSSGKKRRTTADSAGSVDRSLLVRLLVYLTFITGMWLLALGAPENSVLAQSEYTATTVAVALAFVAILVLVLNHEPTAGRGGRSLLALGAVFIQVLLVRLVAGAVDANNLTEGYKVLLAPYALAPLVLSVLIGSRVGIFGTIMSGLFGGLFMPLPWLLPFYIISFCCGIAVVIVAQNVRKRGRLLRAGLYAGLVVLFFAFSFDIFDDTSWDQFSDPEVWKPMAQKCSAALGVGIIVALLISGLLPVLESVFSLTTNISWLELSDLNHKLLRQMQLEAPGTFHHSLIVASLAEAAAEEIGANAPMCRVCSYFHDIGKLKKPEYFIENQHDGLNPHDTLTPTMSAIVIIAHVKDGVDIALKNNLNPRIIEVIQEHHGDSLVYYFYRKAQEQELADSENIDNVDDLPKIDEKNFRYPGPRPRSVESGIISLADAVESASRSLKKPTPAKIRALVDDIVMTRLRDGQLDNCSLTMTDLLVIRESFAKTLRSMMHTRINYPKDDETLRSDKKGTQKMKADTAKSKTSPESAA